LPRYPKIIIPLLLAGALVLGGCENMDAQSQRVLSGGATVTVVTGGCVACGAAVGGAVGAGVGYVVDQMEKK
jgi:osmotically inducible lipoprotein OsmB